MSDVESGIMRKIQRRAPMLTHFIRLVSKEDKVGLAFSLLSRASDAIHGP